jgi:uncharacterized cysteine cluster protein YcgN (CxxCxxCC family)
MDEALCDRCGKCCYEKISVEGRVHITPFPCEHLDLETNLCRIYPHRFEMNPTCISVAEGLAIGAFPSSCGYVSRHAPPNYQPALEEWSWQDQWEDFDELADSLNVPAAIRALVRSRDPDHRPSNP